MPGLSVYLDYAAGFTLVVGVRAVTAVLSKAAVAARLRRIMPNLNPISGLLLVAVGLYVAYYGFYEVRLFSGTAGPDDPLTAGWVHSKGAWPWISALSVLAVVTAAWRTSAAKYRRADRATVDDEP